MLNQSGYRDLVALWQRYDWRESIFAPGIFILQALLPDGTTASGAGRRRETALGRCVGETAEWHALSKAVGTDRWGYAAGRDGIAAHPDPEIARRTALLEAFERFAVVGWWLGRLPGRSLTKDWLAENGISQRLAEARHGAAQKRRTGLWQIKSQTGPVVMVCRSVSFRGQQPILGYGCDPEPRRAAEKAVSEMFLMELNLVELLAAGATGAASLFDPVRLRIESFARRCPALLPAQPQVTPDQNDTSTSPETAHGWFGARVDLQEITPIHAQSENPVFVWLCRPAIPAPDVSDPNASPFL
jgi:YcaO cyclodehydratase, ATP-ad Mg2+-binding